MNTDTATAGSETHKFEAETGRVLELVINSLYSKKEIFLRELISNASDACDRLRYAALTEPDLTKDDPELKVTIAINKKKRTITVSDNGVGMNREDLISNLGTIARSGTAAFLNQMSGDNDADMSLIGQFGVGFYASYMVADRITVTTSKAGDDDAWQWVSDGAGEYTIEPVARSRRGTSIELHLRKGQNEFLEDNRLRTIIKTYSDHIALPIFIDAPKSDKDDDDEIDLTPVNTASALWTRPRKDITDEQYKEFYHHTAHAFDDPWLILHNKAEGRLEYTNLLFVPSTKPFDLFDPERRHQVKLYVRRVYITDNCEELLPSWLRFMRGIVDSEDLPLNISREMLQSNPVVEKIRKALVKRLIGEFKKKAEKAPEEYATFWENFGPVIKEGIYEDHDNRDGLLEIARFHSTKADGLVSLADYVERMKTGQDKIFYIYGEDLAGLRTSPQIEGLVARGIEVLLLNDPVDEFWTSRSGDYQEKSFQSVTRGGIDLSGIESDEQASEDADSQEDAAAEEDITLLITAIKSSLGETVKDVRVSDRLTDSAVCLVADEGALDMHIERLLKQHNQLDSMSQKVLEINPKNGLIKALAARAQAKPSDEDLAEAAHLLLDQARIIEGEPVPDPAAFSRRMTMMMTKGF